MRRFIAISLAAASALFSPGRAGAQQPGELLCGVCKVTGKVKHHVPLADDAVEAGCSLCSVVLESDPEALGMDWVVCPKCQTPSVQAQAKREFDAEFGRRKTWLETQQKRLEPHAPGTVVYVQTPHFVVAWSVAEIKVGRQVLGRHAAAHLYAKRMEELYQQVLDIHGITESDTNHTMHELYWFESERAARDTALDLTGLNLAGGFRTSKIGNISRFVGWDDKKEIQDDERRHQFWVHSVSHHLHNDVSTYKYWLFERYGWVYEGLAHYLEIRNFGPPITWCHREAGGFQHWKGPNWEAAVRKAVLAGDPPNFQDVILKSADTLDAREHAFSWSWIDYLMWYDAKKLPAMLGLMKGAEQVPTRDALKQAYGMTIGQFLDGWTEFVKTQYSARPRKGPTVRAPRPTGD